jgi:hypothetical protein
MDWAHILTIAGLNISMFAALAGLVVWTVNKHDSELKSIHNRLDGHASRIDQLYQMFVDLIKEGRK